MRYHSRWCFQNRRNHLQRRKKLRQFVFPRRKILLKCVIRRSHACFYLRQFLAGFHLHFLYALYQFRFVVLDFDFLPVASPKELAELFNQYDYPCVIFDMKALGCVIYNTVGFLKLLIREHLIAFIFEQLRIRIIDSLQKRCDILRNVFSELLKRPIQL